MYFDDENSQTPLYLINIWHKLIIKKNQIIFILCNLCPTVVIVVVQSDIMSYQTM